MSTDVIQINYEDMDKIASQFNQQSECMAEMLQQVKQKIDPLQNGGWIGRGADAFFEEMQGEVLPALQRLVDALAMAQQTSQQISQTMESSEQEGASVFSEAEAGGLTRGAGSGSARAGRDGGGGNTTGNTTPQSSLDQTIRQMAERLGQTFDRIMSAEGRTPFDGTTLGNNGSWQGNGFSPTGIRSIDEVLGRFGASTGLGSFNQDGFYGRSSYDSGFGASYGAGARSNAPNWAVPQDWLSGVDTLLGGTSSSGLNDYGIPNDWLSGVFSGALGQNQDWGIPSDWLDETREGVQADLDLAQSEEAAPAESGGGGSSGGGSGGGGGSEEQAQQEQGGGGSGGGGQPEEAQTEPETERPSERASEPVAGMAAGSGAASSINSPYGGGSRGYGSGTATQVGAGQAEAGPPQGFRYQPSGGSGGSHGGQSASAAPQRMGGGGGMVAPPPPTQSSAGLGALVALAGPLAALFGKVVRDRVQGS